MLTILEICLSRQNLDSDVGEQSVQDLSTGFLLILLSDCKYACSVCWQLNDPGLEMGDKMAESVRCHISYSQPCFSHVLIDPG